MIRRNRGPDDIAEDGHRALQLQLREFGVSPNRGSELRHRAITLKNDHSLAGRRHAIKDGQTAGLEILMCWWFPYDQSSGPDILCQQNAPARVESDLRLRRDVQVTHSTIDLVQVE